MTGIVPIKTSESINGLARCAARGLMAAIIALALVGSIPLPVAAAPSDPVDLELGGAGATSWSISNIEPGDNGTQVVELHNAGTGAGFVTVWVSDIVSSEGVNPASETGNTAEPGELDEALLFNISSNRSNTTLNLPATINKLPHSSTDPNSIEIIPLKSGDNITLEWSWNLPALTGNNVQGDRVSFTLNYLLREFEITDVSGIVTPAGVFTDNVTVAPADTGGKFVINKDTIGKTKEDQPLGEVWIIEIDKTPLALPGNQASVGAQYDLGPDGATFDRPVTITLDYNPADIPARARAADLVIAFWDEDAEKWVELGDNIVDTLNRTVSAPGTHFSRYTILVPVPPPPPPSPGFSVAPPSPPSGLLPPPPPAPVLTARLLEVDMGGRMYRVESKPDGTLLEPLTLADPSGNFILDIAKDTRVIGANNMPLSRIDLVLTEESILVPDDIVVLSPVYKLTGYTTDMEASRVNFAPSARLTISYNLRDLPENIFTPFIGRYTDEDGLVRLPPPPDATIETGKVRAEITQASLFAVMAQRAPPPPPLPAKFAVSNLSINPRQTQLGQLVIISLTIANDGETAGSYELYLIIDGIVRAVKEITLGGKSTQTVSFEVANLAAGKHQVKVAGLTGELRIISAAALLPEAQIDWLTIDLSVAAVIVASLMALYLFIRGHPDHNQKTRFSQTH